LRRLLTICLCSGLALAAAASCATATTKHRAPVHLLIDAQEWSLWPSRGTVPAGTVLVELWNRGQDMHDTEVRRLDAAGQMVGGVVARVRVTRPGQISQATWHLKAGHYELFCSMPGHLALGMHARLTVTRS
jgi:uncharacterized cupredoxin-like copper-binding protein